MGQCAYSDVFIKFKTEAEAKKAFKILRDFNKIVVNRWKADSGGLSELGINETSISCKISSGRVQNCEWQVQRAAILCSEIGGVEEFSGNIVVDGDGIYFSKDTDEETFEEFVSEFKK